MSSGLFEILTKIKAKPGMYIGKASVSDLFMFLVGYKTARRELGIELTEKEADFCENFHNFVENKYNLHTSNSWDKIIMLFCHHEKDGFEDFFKLLDEFKQRDKNLDGDLFDEISSENNTHRKDVYR
jgi:hypothetical protein